MEFTQKNLSCRKKIVAFINTIAFVFVVLWVGVYFIFPHYAKSFHYGNYTLYIHDGNVNKKQIDTIFEKSINVLRKNPLYSAENAAKIYVLNNSLLYAILNPLEVVSWWSSYAGTIVGNTILVKEGDFAANKVYNKKYSENFDAVLTHELTHTLQFDHYGSLFTAYRMPTWVREGYATYSENELPTHSIEQLYKKSFLQLRGEVLHAPLEYQLWALMVKHAIEKMHKSVDDLHLGKVSYDEVFASLLDEYNISTSK
jgi:hypothetical protein